MLCGIGWVASVWNCCAEIKHVQQSVAPVHARFLLFMFVTDTALGVRLD